MTKTRIVQIGNSQGVRIPKPLLEQAQLSDEVELVVQEVGLLIRPVRRVRAGWDEHFRTMASHGDDALFDADMVALSAWEDEK